MHFKNYDQDLKQNIRTIECMDEHFLYMHKLILFWQEMSLLTDFQAYEIKLQITLERKRIFAVLHHTFDIWGNKNLEPVYLFISTRCYTSIKRIQAVLTQNEHSRKYIVIVYIHNINFIKKKHNILCYMWYWKGISVPAIFRAYSASKRSDWSVVKWLCQSPTTPIKSKTKLM